MILWDHKVTWGKTFSCFLSVFGVFDRIIYLECTIFFHSQTCRRSQICRQCIIKLSHVMRKPVLAICEQQGADQPAHPCSLISTFVDRNLSAIHMHTFTYLCKFYIYVNFTHLCKSEQVNANTYLSIFTYVQIYSWVWPSVKVYLLLHSMYLRMFHHVIAK